MKTQKNNKRPKKNGKKTRSKKQKGGTIFTPTTKEELKNAVMRWVDGDRDGLGNISDWNINKALDQISEKEYNDKLKNLCEKKIDTTEKPSPKLKDKIIRSLTYKGWEIDKVIKLVNQLTK